MQLQFSSEVLSQVGTSIYPYLNSADVISDCVTPEVLGTGILKEFLEFHIHFFHQSSGEEVLF